jgi:(p)ppGpp synthase/HD superfamily hydrolase
MLNQLDDKATETIRKAAAAVVRLHTDFRKEKSGRSGNLPVPYFFHPFDVAKRLYHWGQATVPRIIAALGHDLIENLKLTPEDLFTEFGRSPGVGEGINIIINLTFLPPEDISEQEAAALKAAYIEKLAGLSIDNIIVKEADRYCNAKDFEVAKPNYAKKYFYKALPIHKALILRQQELNGYEENWPIIRKDLAEFLDKSGLVLG